MRPRVVPVIEYERRASDRAFDPDVAHLGWVTSLTGSALLAIASYASCHDWHEAVGGCGTPRVTAETNLYLYALLVPAIGWGIAVTRSETTDRRVARAAGVVATTVWAGCVFLVRTGWMTG